MNQIAVNSRTAEASDGSVWLWHRNLNQHGCVLTGSLRCTSIIYMAYDHTEMF